MKWIAISVICLLALVFVAPVAMKFGRQMVEYVKQITRA